MQKAAFDALGIDASYTAIEAGREQGAEVGERVTDGAHLPVKHGHDLAGPGRMQDGVVQAVVPVDDRHRNLPGHGTH